MTDHVGDQIREGLDHVRRMRGATAAFVVLDEVEGWYARGGIIPTGPATARIAADEHLFRPGTDGVQCIRPDHEGPCRRLRGGS
ncbi:hypothetical protein [Actinoallomurus sp. NPDC052274]|uniref:hypothetical protein n=1 Tax=Actinoallomurus sp. NPDC052274 TaxID=3155420 RepID=UPI0034322A4C